RAPPRRAGGAPRLRPGVRRHDRQQRASVRPARPRRRGRRDGTGGARRAADRDRRPHGAGGGAGTPELSVRIGIGALVGIVGGPATYARELVAALAALGGHEYVVFTDRPEQFAAVDVERILVPMATTYHQVTWDHVRLPGLLTAHGVALYHG